MRKIAIVAVPLMLLAVVVFSSPASAASVEEVVAACDKMDAAKPGSCRYTTDDKGLGGCTRNGCFYCPADGSRQCHATRTTAKPPTSGKPEFVVKIGSIHLACNRQDQGWCKADVVQR